MKPNYLAAIGSNNEVYGLGHTIEEARMDAKAWTHYCTDNFKTIPITKEAFDFIQDFGFNAEFIIVNNDEITLNNRHLEIKEAVSSLVEGILILK